jgi:tetratricopeptide (TPR) repeat protein
LPGYPIFLKKKHYAQGIFIIAKMNSFALMRYCLIYTLLISFVVSAQQNDEQLATQYFGNGEYAKAADMYEKLINRDPSSTYIYDNLLTCYIKTTQWSDADKLIKKQQKRFPDNAFYKVDIAYIRQLSGTGEKNNKYFNELISQLDGTDKKTTQLASAFQKRGYQQEAITTYLKARKMGGFNATLYALPLAQLYDQIGDNTNMVEEYLNALENNPRILPDVQGLLQDHAMKPASYDIIRNALLKRLKVYPDNDMVQDLLIWLYVQKRDFSNAFTQARSLDKRYKEDGRRVMELGIMALQNDAYDAAINMFVYVISLGTDKPYHLNASMQQLEAKRLKIVKSRNYTQQDIVSLEQAYKNFLQENGRYHFTAPVMRDLARLYVYYQNKVDEGIAMYKEIIDQPRIEAKFVGNVKLELGDIYLLQGEEWEAMLLYGQVDKDFKEDPLGQEAKFRNARLSYYLGEFEWARAQLDVLKTATTQLISNNALELSLLIQDNTIDSNEVPLSMYAKADLYFYQQKYTRALNMLDSVSAIYPRHALADDVLFKRAQIAVAQQDHQASLAYYQRIVKEHSSGIWGDNALFAIAELYHYTLNEQDKAIEYYTQLLADYPGSFFTTEARKRIRMLRGEQIN